MNAEQVFALAGQLVMPCWLILIVSLFWARARPVAQWLARFGIPVVLGATYVYALGSQMPAEQGGFGSIADVRVLFSNDWLLLAGWVHYLVFDFFVGAWVARDSDKHNIHGLLVIPCLVLCFLAGPAGLLLYLVLRGGRLFVFKPAS